MYCDKQAHVETRSYSKLVTTGSMALLPGQTTHHPTASAKSTAAPISTSNASLLPTDSSDEPQGSSGTPIVAAIISGIVISLCVGCLLYCFCWGRSRVWRNKVRAFIASHIRLPRHRIADASRQNNHAMAPRGRANISTTNAMHPNDYLSPISRNRMARQAEARDVQTEELESIQAPAELEGPGRQPEADWLDSTSHSRKLANPSSRWSASNIPVSFQQRQLDRERRFNSLNDMLIAPDRPAFEHPDASVDSLISPLVGGVSPLMGSDARASVGEPPVRRGSITHCTPTKIRHSWARARCDSPLFGEPGTATSYTRGLPFLTREQELEREKRIEAAATCTKKAGAAEDNAGEAAGEEKAIAELSDAEIGHAEAAQHNAGSFE